MLLVDNLFRLSMSLSMCVCVYMISPFFSLGCSFISYVCYCCAASVLYFLVVSAVTTEEIKRRRKRRKENKKPNKPKRPKKRKEFILTCWWLLWDERYRFGDEPHVRKTQLFVCQNNSEVYMLRFSHEFGESLGWYGWELPWRCWSLLYKYDKIVYLDDKFPLFFQLLFHICIRKNHCLFPR